MSMHQAVFTYVSSVASDTTYKVTYHYFVNRLLFLYCLDPKLAMTAFS